MSQKTPNETTVHDITSMPTDESTASLVEKRPNVAVRAFRKIKNTPPKTALAVAGGVALVAAGAMLGRSTASYHVEVVDSELELEPILVTPASEESSDSVA